MTSVFEAISSCEQVVFVREPSSGTRAIIAIHSTELGPALGGVRFYPYADDTAALRDAVQLAHTMTLKSAAADLDLGGGKAVVIGEPGEVKTEGLLRWLGRVVHGLAGRFIAACDVGTTCDDLDVMAHETTWARGGSLAQGCSGDSSVSTARGVHEAMLALAERCWGERELKGRVVAVQGLGKVGRRVAELAFTAGARLYVSEPDEHARQDAVDRLDAEPVALDEIYDTDADIFSPNALGGTLNDVTIRRLTSRLVVGGANNQLEDPDRHAAQLQDREILYAPDFVVNAGGLIQVVDELHPLGPNPERVAHAIGHLPARLLRIVDVSQRTGRTANEVAHDLASERIAALKRSRSYWRPATVPRYS